MIVQIALGVVLAVVLLVILGVLLALLWELRGLFLWLGALTLIAVLLCGLLLLAVIAWKNIDAVLFCSLASVILLVALVGIRAVLMIGIGFIKKLNAKRIASDESPTNT